MNKKSNSRRFKLNPSEMLELAHFHYFTRKSTSDAVAWYVRAANCGVPLAQSILGEILADGEMGGVDIKRAIYWWRRASIGKDSDAMTNLGRCYFYGNGVSADNKKAIYYYRRAIKYESGEACFNLGLMYWKGEGVRENSFTAKRYMDKAVLLGNSLAKRFLKKNTGMRLCGKGVVEGKGSEPGKGN